MTLQLTNTVAEIFYEIVSNMEDALHRGDNNLQRHYDEAGTTILWAYGKQWTEEFVLLHPDSTSWGGTFIDMVEAFTQEKINNL